MISMKAARAAKAKADSFEPTDAAVRKMLAAKARDRDTSQYSHKSQTEKGRDQER